MEYRVLGKTGMKVSLLSLGSGGPNRFGQARYVPKDRINRLVHLALERGVNFFDTSAAYQNSETILGKALAGTARDRFYIASKVRPVHQGRIITAAQLRTQVERSLSRLRVPELDIIQLHGLTLRHYDEAIDRLMPELDSLQHSGKVRFLGVTEASAQDPKHEMLERALDDDIFDSIMVAYHPANIIAGERLLPLARQRDVGVICMAAARHLVNPGMAARLETAGRLLAGLALHNPGRRLTMVRLKDTWSMVAGRLPERVDIGTGEDGSDEMTGPAAGYLFAASHPAVATVLTGTVNLSHFDQNVEAIVRSSTAG